MCVFFCVFLSIFKFCFCFFCYVWDGIYDFDMIMLQSKELKTRFLSLKIVVHNLMVNCGLMPFYHETNR